MRRTRSGRFTIAQAVALADVRAAALVPPEAATDLPVRTVPAIYVPYLFNGVQLGTHVFLGPEAQRFQLLDEQGRLLAVAHDEAGRTVYDRVFPELSR